MNVHVAVASFVLVRSTTRLCLSLHLSLVLMPSHARCFPQDEKLSLAAIFERETRREKNLELRYIQRRRDIKEKKKAAEVSATSGELQGREVMACARKVESEACVREV